MTQLTMHARNSNMSASAGGDWQSSLSPQGGKHRGSTCLVRTPLRRYPHRTSCPETERCKKTLVNIS
ncbi:hypothetical protein ILYODFUR_009405 [Ilyodon furcidens]|uniref:Uncharacterized protein n=1 Tax=Ilyodon furcidens TaxID=33524 RepID=A0ABV0VD48_9TELE